MRRQLMQRIIGKREEKETRKEETRRGERNPTEKREREEDNGKREITKPRRKRDVERGNLIRGRMSERLHRQ